MTGLNPVEMVERFEIKEFTLTLQKSRMLQIQGAEGAAVVAYCKSLATQKMRYHRLSRLATLKI